MSRALKIVGALFGAALLAAIAWRLHWTIAGPQIASLPHGPEGRLVLPTFAAPAVEDFERGGPHRLALLVTDPDSAWFALAEGLRTAGVPLVATRDWKRALGHRFVVAYPTVSGRTLPPEALRAISAHVRGGGAVVAFGLLGGGLAETFGVGAEPVESKTRRSMAFAPSALARLPAHAADTTIRLGAPDKPQAVLGSLGFTLAGGTAEASWDDGSAAFVARTLDGGGAAYAVGLDAGDVLARAANSRTDGLVRRYANGFDATCEVVVDWIAERWAAHEPYAARLGLVPRGRELPVLLTHDIDYTRSLGNALAYARREAEQGVPATYFIQTKYVRDWNDDAFFDDRGYAMLGELAKFPLVEIGSHSVAHARALRRSPFGSGDERFPDYRPQVTDVEEARGVTVSGEVRVSKFLLERGSGKPVVSFRPGHLANPETLPETLAGAGYRYSSSTAANDSISHRPFMLMQGRAGRAPTGIVELPVTIEDEHLPPLLQRLPDALALAERLARLRALYVLLIHTDTVGDKLEFQTRFVEAWKSRAWFGTVESFGRFWSARRRVALDIDAANAAAPALLLDAPEAIAGLAVELPPGFAVAPGETGVVRVGASQAWVIERLEGRRRLRLVRSPG